MYFNLSLTCYIYSSSFSYYIIIVVVILVNIVIMIIITIIHLMSVEFGLDDQDVSFDFLHGGWFWGTTKPPTQSLLRALSPKVSRSPNEADKSLSE